MARRRLTGRAYHAGREQAVLLPFFRFTHPLPPMFSRHLPSWGWISSQILPQSQRPTNTFRKHFFFWLNHSISQLVVGSVILLISRSFFHNICRRSPPKLLEKLSCILLECG